MTRAIVARRNGDDYQALFFWREAGRLFHPFSKVEKVGYEHSSVKSFDDVVKFYSTPVLDRYGDNINADYFQLKFHVDYDDFFTYENLTVPAFIGATSQSLLQKLLNAQRSFAPDGTGSRFHIVSSRQLHPENKLRNLISTYEGEIRLIELFSPTNYKTIRQYWCDNLGICNEEELKLILRPLRIWAGSESFERLKASTNQSLMAAGLKPIDDDSRVSQYISLIQRLHSEDKTIFTREELQDVAVKEKLWVGQKSVNDEASYLGLRSFMPRAEQMENMTEKMLCLVKYFDNRVIREQKLWQEKIYPEIKAFFAKSTDSTKHYRLYLDTHNSIAFAAGYEMPSKTGIKIYPMQSTRAGREPWEPDFSAPNSTEQLWNVNTIPMNESSAASDVALAISISRDVTQDVELYVHENLLSVRKIIDCKVKPIPGQTAISDANHGFQLVEQLINIASSRNINERRARLHIFAAAPNSILFWLGQAARGLGLITIYEFDFDNMTPGGYLPAIELPAAS